jgi:hypothetical protein
MNFAAPHPSDVEWIAETRSEASEATVASTADYGKLQKPLLGGCESPPSDWRRPYSKPSKSSETKYSLMVIISVALLAGIIIGFVLAYLLLSMMIASKAIADVQVHEGPYQLAAPAIGVPEAYYAAQPFDNSNLIPNLRTISSAAAKPQTFDACGFVVRSTDDVWNKRENVDEAIEKYFHEDYVDAGSWGRRIIGKKALKEAVWGEMRAFPDIQIHITDCLCLGNDVDGYKCAMPDVLTGTNTGPSAYGPATGNRAKWTGLVESFVKQNPKTGQWQYYAEWGVHDEWALVQQLGLDFTRVPHPVKNLEPLHDGKALVPFSNGQFGIDEYDKIQQTLHDAQKF